MQSAESSQVTKHTKYHPRSRAVKQVEITSNIGAFATHLFWINIRRFLTHGQQQSSSSSSSNYGMFSERWGVPPAELWLVTPPQNSCLFQLCGVWQFHTFLPRTFQETVFPLRKPTYCMMVPEGVHRVGSSWCRQWQRSQCQRWRWRVAWLLCWKWRLWGWSQSIQLRQHTLIVDPHQSGVYVMAYGA